LNLENFKSRTGRLQKNSLKKPETIKRGVLLGYEPFKRLSAKRVYRKKSEPNSKIERQKLSFEKKEGKAEMKEKFFVKKKNF